MSAAAAWWCLTIRRPLVDMQMKLQTFSFDVFGGPVSEDEWAIAYALFQ